MKGVEGLPSLRKVVEESACTSPLYQALERELQRARAELRWFDADQIADQIERKMPRLVSGPREELRSRRFSKA